MKTAEGAPRSLDSASIEMTLFAAVLAAAHEHGGEKPVLEDIERSPLTYKRLILGSMVLGAKLTAGTRPGAAVGVLLPNVNGMVVTLLGLNAFGRVAALLNFTAGARNLVSAVQTGLIEPLPTYRRRDVPAAVPERLGEPAAGAARLLPHLLQHLVLVVPQAERAPHPLHHHARPPAPARPAVVVPPAPAPIPPPAWAGGHADQPHEAHRPDHRPEHVDSLGWVPTTSSAFVARSSPAV